MRIVFFGTPDFAVASLRALIESGSEVVAVVTAPDRPAGRGYKPKASAVKEYALEQDIPLLQPENLKAPDFQKALFAYRADVQVVVAFRMLPESVWNHPPQGTINVHASLLPHYRGAAPINWAIIHGETETGVTTFRLQHAIDTGHILLQERVAITPEDTAGILHDKLMEAGASLLVRTLEGIRAGTLQEVPQDSLTEPGAILREAPKLHKDTCRISWNKPVEQVHNLIRGLSPFPGAFTQLQQQEQVKVFKIYRSSIHHDDSLKPGEWQTNGSDWLLIGCVGGAVELHEIQLEGKKRMPVRDFLRGFTFTPSVRIV